MRKSPVWAALPVLFWCAASHSQEGTEIAPPTDLRAPGIAGVVAEGTPIALIESGLERTEGPVGMPDGSVLFTGRNSIFRIGLDDNTSTFIEHSNASNALGLDPDGRIISVQRASGNEKVGVLYPIGRETVLADGIDGKPFSRLNDLVVSSKGAVYFTDQNGIYYLPPGGGQPKTVERQIQHPNGVILSPDERTLYANDKDGQFLLAFDVEPDGTLSKRRPFARYSSVRVPGHRDPSLAEDNGADGLTVDSDERLYVATNLGIEVFDATGQQLGILPIVWGGERFSLRKPQNLAFAGPDKQTLYVVGAGAVFKVRLLAHGLGSRAK